MNASKIKLMGFSLLTFFLISTLIWAQESQVTNKALIKFSHTFHYEDVDCADCHTAVSESTSLDDELLPTMDACGECHDIEDDENCELCHYEDVYEPLVRSGAPLIFNHSFHLEKQELDCENCHKGLADVEYGIDSPEIFPAMAVCADCHNVNEVAQTACESCHISTAELLPESHTVADFKRMHKFSAQQQNADCAMCHQQDFCGTCHEATTVLGVTNTAADVYTPYSPHTFKDGAKQQQISRVHDLNYQFTHGIDANDKSMDCTTCHNQETFCTECHTSTGGDVALGGFVPKSHTVNNWTTLGVGSGGGEHAILARRNIESCASCHDTQGADPACLLCHNDPDGIQGTNPRTHEANFMRDVKGDWMTDDGSVCFDCHINTNVPGTGFCGYCHGAEVQ